MQQPKLSLKDLKQQALQLKLDTDHNWLVADIKSQQLYLFKRDTMINSYIISTASFGIGNIENSWQTPLGWHIIAQKIGANCALNEIFKQRQPTGVQASIITAPKKAAADLITSRIMWLKGLEQGINCGSYNGKLIDTYQRYIYIHGTNEEGLLGRPASLGCIRMKNTQVVELFALVSVQTPLCIVAEFAGA